MPFVTWKPANIPEEARTSIKTYIAATNMRRCCNLVHLDASELWERWAGLSHASCGVIASVTLLPLKQHREYLKDH
ncbi:methyltransferase-like 26 B [Nerophis lumbriciformis]|uniref:methyltransferase-like 26 B n=1 Tax=Nerophis lumbriciformis TaxID=546530 RepID=UPI003BADB615